MLEEIGPRYVKRKNSSLDYPCTNECIEAVIAGLDFRASDTLVAIAGSGDIPIAAAPFVKKVYAVDISIRQIKFMKNQLRMLDNGDLEGFFHNEITEEDCPAEYDVRFEDIGRRREYFYINAEQVQRSFGKIEVVESGMIEFLRTLEPGSVNALYLSNIHLNPEVFPKGLECSEKYYEAVKCIAKGGRVYHSDASFMEAPEGFRVLEENSSLAKDLERRLNPRWNWLPKVLEKL